MKRAVSHSLDCSALMSWSAQNNHHFLNLNAYYFNDYPESPFNVSSRILVASSYYILSLLVIFNMINPLTLQTSSSDLYFEALLQRAQEFSSSWGISGHS
jgi:hypothetical protein